MIRSYGYLFLGNRRELGFALSYLSRLDIIVLRCRPTLFRRAYVASYVTRKIRDRLISDHGTAGSSDIICDITAHFHPFSPSPTKTPTPSEQVEDLPWCSISAASAAEQKSSEDQRHRAAEQFGD